MSQDKIKVGNHIYLAPSLSYDDKFRAGRATISRISSSYGATFIEVIELPDTSFNLDLLLPVQEELKKQFDRQTARPNKREVKRMLKGKLQVAVVALEAARSYAPSLLSDLDERDLSQSKAALKRMQKRIK